MSYKFNIFTANFDEVGSGSSAVTSVDGKTGAVDLSGDYQPLENQGLSTGDDVNFNTVNGGTLSGNNGGDQSASDFNHDDLSNITGTPGEFNHPTDAQMTVLSNTSNTNTGDQDLSGLLPKTLTSTNIFVGNGSNIATGVAVSGDAMISNTGVLSVNKTRLIVRNETGTTIPTTRAVYASGFNNYPLIGLANNATEIQHNVIGVTVGSISHEANGYIATGGQFDAETNTWDVGTELYLSTSGQLTDVAPTSGSVKHVGIVTVKENYPTGKILFYNQSEENYLAGGADVDTIIRMGDSAGVNKTSFRDYANNEVASIDSDGNFTSTNLTATDITDLTDGGETTLHTHPSTGGGFWTDISGAYASATTITVAGEDITSYMKKGVVLKWRDSGDTTDSYAMVISSTFSTDTTITVVGSSVVSGDINFKYCVQPARKMVFDIVGDLTVGTNISKKHRVEESIQPISVDFWQEVTGSGSATTIDVNDDGTSIITTKPSIAAAGLTDLDNVVTSPTTAIASGSIMSIDCDAEGSTTPAQGGAVILYYIPTYYILMP